MLTEDPTVGSEKFLRGSEEKVPGIAHKKIGAQIGVRKGSIGLKQATSIKGKGVCTNPVVKHQRVYSAKMVCAHSKSGVYREYRGVQIEWGCVQKP